MASKKMLTDRFYTKGGKFYTKDESIERYDGPTLRRLFENGRKKTSEADKLMKQKECFIASQLKHYGIDTRGLDKRGMTESLKKAISTGKCDKVPGDIRELEQQMHQEWIGKLDEDQLADHPKWIMDRYFLNNAGKADREKTIRVVSIPLRRSSKLGERIKQATKAVKGLHHEVDTEATRRIYLGWNKAQIERAIKNQVAMDAKQKEEDDQDDDEWIAERKKQQNRKASPAGSYVMKWKKKNGKNVNDLPLNIRQTPETDVFEAYFQLADIENTDMEGIMILSTEEDAMNDYCAMLERDLDREDEPAQEENTHEKLEESEDHKEDKPDVDVEEEVNQDTNTPANPPTSKRKPSSPLDRTQSKKTKVPEDPLRYFLRWKGRNLKKESDFIEFEARKGEIRFENDSFTNLVGKIERAPGLDDAKVTAHQQSPQPVEFHQKWNGYSKAAHDRALEDRKRKR